MTISRRSIFLMAACLPLLAHAQAAAEQKVALTAQVAASPQEVWAAIGNFQDMNWHPVVHATTGTGGNEVGATRLLVLGAEDGPTIDELLDVYSDENMTYSYRITQVAVDVLPVTNYSAQLTVTPADDGQSIVEWRGEFNRGFPDSDPPPELNDEAAVAAVTGVYQAGLDALVARFADN